MPDEKSLSFEMEQKILKAATIVFIRKGKAGSSMQDIADEAGINRTLLNYYFRSKDKLFEQVFSIVFLQFIPAIISRINSEKPVTERFEDVIDYYFQVLLENPHIPVFILQEISSSPQRIIKSMREKGLDPESFLRVLSDEMEKGNIRKMDPRSILINLLSLVIFPFAASPMIVSLLFAGDSEAFTKFLRERRSELKRSFIESIKGKQ